MNADKVAKPAYAVGAGDVLTFAQARHIRVIRIETLGDRRGPAAEAQLLYSDLSAEQDNVPQNPRFEGKGRPTKRDRRNRDLSRGSALED